MAVKCFPSRGSVNTNFLMGKKVTSRVVHSGIRNYGKSPLQIIRGAPFQSRAQFVAAPFAGLLQSPCQNCGRTGRPLGRRSQQIIFLRTYHEWPKAKRAIISARVGRFSAARNEERSMAGYGGVDFIDFDSQLNDEEKLVRQTA